METMLYEEAPPSAAPAAHVFDRAHLARFTLGDEGLEREVLGLFIAETPRRIAALKSASSDKEWKMAAHTLKGSGRALGAWRLAQSAHDAESLGGIADPEACKRAARLVEFAIAEFEVAVRAAYPHV